MNAYNPLSSAQRLEAAGFPRGQADAIAAEMGQSTNDLVTKEQLEAALDRVTIRLSVILGGIVTLACTILGVVLSNSM